MIILILINPNASGITELGPRRYAITSDGQPLQAEEVLKTSRADAVTALRAAMRMLRLRKEREDVS